jgi:hypothetical protein
MAVAELGGAQRGEDFGVGGGLRRAEGLQILGDGVFIRAGERRASRPEARREVRWQAPVLQADDDRCSWLPPLFWLCGIVLMAGTAI